MGNHGLVQPVDVEALSTKFVGSLDRSSLGSFAVDEYMLYLADVIQRSLQVLWNAIDNTTSLKTDHAVKTIELQELVGNRGTLLAKVYAELFLWWKLSGNEKSIAYVKRYFADGHNGYMLAQMDVLNTVFLHPKKHDYFVAGVWDVEFIERCISENIDPSIASEMSV